jgi:hypothetical protein
MILVNGDLFDDPDPESEAASGWVGDEPWPCPAGLDQDALDGEWCDGDGSTLAPPWVVDRILRRRPRLRGRLLVYEAVRPSRTMCSPSHAPRA